MYFPNETQVEYYLNQESLRNIIMRRRKQANGFRHTSLKRKKNFVSRAGFELYILGGKGVPGILSDWDDRRIFLGFEFSIPGFFGVRKFGKCFLGSLI